jgi:prefoldin subunit 5
MIAMLQEKIATLTAERDEARHQLKEAKDRNTKLLSSIQEYEAREQ